MDPPSVYDTETVVSSPASNLSSPVRVKMNFRYANTHTLLKAVWWPVLGGRIVPDPLRYRPYKVRVFTVDEAFQAAGRRRFQVYAKLAGFVKRLEESGHPARPWVKRSIERTNLCHPCGVTFEGVDREAIGHGCGQTWLCPYCWGRSVVLTSHRRFDRGLKRAARTLRHPWVVARLQVRLRVPTKDLGAYGACRAASDLLSRLGRRLRRQRGLSGRAFGGRGSILLAQVRPDHGHWTVIVRGLAVMKDDRPETAEGRFRAAVRYAARVPYPKGLRRPRASAVRFWPRRTPQSGGREISRGRFLANEVGWLARFLDVAAAPPQKLVTMMRSRRKFKLLRASGVFRPPHRPPLPDLFAAEAAFRSTTPGGGTLQSNAPGPTTEPPSPTE